MNISSAKLLPFCLVFNVLIQLPLVSHIIYASVNWASIGLDNGLSPTRCQSIIKTNAGSLSIGLLQTSFSEIWIRIVSFSFKQMRLNIWSAKVAAILPRQRWVNLVTPFPVQGPPGRHDRPRSSLTDDKGPPDDKWSLSAPIVKSTNHQKQKYSTPIGFISRHSRADNIRQIDLLHWLVIRCPNRRNNVGFMFSFLAYHPGGPFNKPNLFGFYCRIFSCVLLLGSAARVQQAVVSLLY